MDPVTVLTVFLKLAMHIPQEKSLFNQRNNDNLSRTQIIEIYRKDMNEKTTFNLSKDRFLN